MADGLGKRTCAEIDLDNAEYNFRQVRAIIKPSCKLCCVVKANGYGHGAVTLGRLYESLGADMLAVSNIAEAVQLRDAGISVPVFILGYTPAECAPLLAGRGMIQCVYSLDYAMQLSQSALRAGVCVRVHIKMDSGMGRIGFRSGDSGDSGEGGVLKAAALGGIEIEGIFTHFALSDEGKGGEEYTRAQYERFAASISALEEKGVHFSIKHCSNSAAALDYPEYNMDMVRAGVVLYGLQPSDKIRRRIDLRPVMTLRSVISHIKTAKGGEHVSYGGEYVAQPGCIIATVPIGYADGFFRSNYSGGGNIEVNGRLCPIVGRICMDQLMIDVTEVDKGGAKLKIGDEVTVFGGGALTASDVARVNHTINYEICCLVGERVPRVYLRAGEVVSVVDYVMNIR